jgi:hypothetical protein
VIDGGARGGGFSHDRSGFSWRPDAAHGAGASHRGLAGRPAVVEVMLNPDGRLWIDRLTEGLTDTGKRLSAADGERIVRLVAHHVGAEVHPASPRVSAELPETGEHFEGFIPPVVASPAFAIRKPAVAVFTLDAQCSGRRWDLDRQDDLGISSNTERANDSSTIGKCDLLAWMHRSWHYCGGWCI